jgi:hypothetical protein
MLVNPLLLGPLLEIGKGIIDRLFPDPEKKAAAELELLKMTNDGELKQILAQLEINAREAQHPSLWVAGWRPGAGWCGVAGLAYVTILQPLLTWLAAVKGWPTPPEMNTDLLWAVLTGMLGIGSLRTFEKAKGVSK